LIARLTRARTTGTLHKIDDDALQRGHSERVHEAQEKHIMSIWKTPAGPDGGDDIALTTPVSAASIAPSHQRPALIIL